MAAVSPASRPGIVSMDEGARMRSHGGGVAMKALASRGRLGEASSDATSMGMRTSLNRVGKTSTRPIATRTTNGEASATTIMGMTARGTP